MRLVSVRTQNLTLGALIACLACGGSEAPTASQPPIVSVAVVSAPVGDTITTLLREPIVVEVKNGGFPVRGMDVVFSCNTPKDPNGFYVLVFERTPNDTTRSSITVRTDDAGR